MRQIKRYRCLISRRKPIIGAVRAYVMGQRGADNEAATTQKDIEKMADIVEDGIKAGALGWTLRTMLHGRDQ